MNAIQSSQFTLPYGFRAYRVTVTLAMRIVPVSGWHLPNPGARKGRFGQDHFGAREGGHETGRGILSGKGRSTNCHPSHNKDQNRGEPVEEVKNATRKEDQDTDLGLRPH